MAAQWWAVASLYPSLCRKHRAGESLEYYAVDKATNQEAKQFSVFSLDLKNPASQAVVLHGLNGSNGWYEQYVTVEEINASLRSSATTPATTSTHWIRWARMPTPPSCRRSSTSTGSAATPTVASCGRASVRTAGCSSGSSSGSRAAPPPWRPRSATCPTPESLDTDGLDLTPEQTGAALDVSPEEWARRDPGDPGVVRQVRRHAADRAVDRARRPQGAPRREVALPPYDESRARSARSGPGPLPCGPAPRRSGRRRRGHGLRWRA